MEKCELRFEAKAKSQTTRRHDWKEKQKKGLNPYVQTIARILIKLN
jgi:hypothetical protein